MDVEHVVLPSHDAGARGSEALVLVDGVGFEVKEDQIGRKHADFVQLFWDCLVNCSMRSIERWKGICLSHSFHPGPRTKCSAPPGYLGALQTDNDAPSAPAAVRAGWFFNSWDKPRN